MTALSKKFFKKICRSAERPKGFPAALWKPSVSDLSAKKSAYKFFNVFCLLLLLLFPVFSVSANAASLQLKQKKIVVTEGEYRSVLLTAKAGDAVPEVVWQSSDPGIAGVTSAGFVKGVSAGTCEITGTAADGTGKPVHAAVTVEPRVPVTAINFGRHKEDGSDNEFYITLKSVTYTRKVESLSFTLQIDGVPGTGSYEFTRTLSHGDTDRDGWWKNYLLNYAKTVQILLVSVLYSDGQEVTFNDRPVIGTFPLSGGKYDHP